MQNPSKMNKIRRCCHIFDKQKAESNSPKKERKQLTYSAIAKKPRERGFFVGQWVAIPPGFEPGTHSLEGCCSIQLSYGTEKERSVYLPRRAVHFPLQN
jgi:hypothetical protein